MTKTEHLPSAEFTAPAGFVDRFWERWIAHCLEQEEIINLLHTAVTEGEWVTHWYNSAQKKWQQAEGYVSSGMISKAEWNYRTAALSVLLIYWALSKSEEKKAWWYKSILATELADTLSQVPVYRDTITIDGKRCYGRIRLPAEPERIVIFVNPIDSTKEEIFTYESDFVERGFLTITFDGPGQGQTWMESDLRASKENWKHFMEEVISYAYTRYPGLPIHLFGTGTGAAWCIYGSTHPLVKSVAAVSPPFTENDPGYFSNREAMESEEGMLPEHCYYMLCKPLFLFHGKQDTLAASTASYRFFGQFPSHVKQFKEYENESYGCAGELDDIREQAAFWYKKEQEDFWDF